MEYSPNQHLLPMKGTVERETRRKVAQARATRLVVQGLVDVRPAPEPYQPSGIPGEIGNVRLPHEYEHPQLPFDSVIAIRFAE